MERGAARSVEDLLVWQKAHAWVLQVYRMSESVPRHELFGLTSQLRRAAVSVPANIAEGFKNRSPADKLRFYNIAQGSVEECRDYLILTRDLGYAETGTLRRFARRSQPLAGRVHAFIQRTRLIGRFLLLASGF